MKQKRKGMYFIGIFAFIVSMIILYAIISLYFKIPMFIIWGLIFIFMVLILIWGFSDY